MNGVAPAPSTLTMPLTSFGRSFITSQLNGPPAECTTMIEGPILSSISAPRLAHSLCMAMLSVGVEFCPAWN